LKAIPIESREIEICFPKNHEQVGGYGGKGKKNDRARIWGALENGREQDYEGNVGRKTLREKKNGQKKNALEGKGQAKALRETAHKLVVRTRGKENTGPSQDEKKSTNLSISEERRRWGPFRTVSGVILGRETRKGIRRRGFGGKQLFEHLTSGSTAKN